MKNHDLQFLQSELSRVSEWVQFADKKAGFIAVFYSAIFGFLLSQRTDILIRLLFDSCGWLYAFTLFALSLSILLGMYFLFATVCPRTKNNHTDKSLFYYGTVAKKKVEDYLREVEKTTEEEAHRQIAEQIYTNSVIANAKMESVKKSTQVLIGVGILLLIFIFL